MAGRIPVSVVSPDSVAWEGEADSLIVPAAEGQLGILPGHAPLLAQLAPGVLQIRDREDLKIVAVSGGFVEVYGHRVSIFAETAELGEQIDAERAHQAAEKARAALRGDAVKTPDPLAAEAALRRALVRMKALEIARRRSMYSKDRPQV